MTEDSFLSNHLVSGLPLSSLPWVGTAIAMAAVRQVRSASSSAQRRVRRARPTPRQRGPHLDRLNGPLGRDGSPSRPFADRVTHLVRPNGGLGEPALPKANTPPIHDTPYSKLHTLKNHGTKKGRPLGRPSLSRHPMAQASFFLAAAFCLRRRRMAASASARAPIPKP